jgi:hypothetical protein
MRSRVTPFAWLFAVVVAGACDPVHSREVDAIPPNAPGVQNGPLHHPGEPCLVCHDGALGDPQAFSMAGTVYQDANSLTPLEGATVTLLGADGSTKTMVTNAAGNFYLTTDEYSPVYPIHVKSIASGTKTTFMQSHIGGNGSCSFCHADPPGPNSPGHVYFDVAGTPP